jgi:DICT domain-containing protein
MIALTVPSTAESHLFSVYSLIEQANASNIFINDLPMLAHFSHTIERAILEHEIDTTIYVSFQYLSRFARQFARYQRIASTAQVYVFGVDDAQYPPLERLHYVSLRPGDRLAREWFLVVSHPQYSRALIAQEVPGGRGTRRYRGVLTSDAALCAAAADELSAYLSRFPARLRR